jgi:bifunctional isochorismate lyase/aryl carrier protein
MAIPTIAEYSLPDWRSLPENRAHWRPDARRAALLVHDMQRYFVKAFTHGGQPITSVLDNISRLRARCRELGVPVFYSAQPGGQSVEERGLLRDFWGGGLGIEVEATAIVSPLEPGPNEAVITKRRYSAFCRTDFLERLVSCDRDQLIVTGVYAHIGCLATTLEGFMCGIQGFLVADAVADFSAEHQRMALEYVAGRCGTVIGSNALLAALESQDPSTKDSMAHTGQAMRLQGR